MSAKKASFVEPKTDIYENTRSAHIHITEDKLNDMLRDFEENKTQKGQLWADLFQTAGAWGVFAIVDFKDALSVSENTWRAFYLFLSCSLTVKFLHCLFSSSQFLRKLVGKSPLLNRKEFIALL